MVTGLDLFKERFAKFTSNYVFRLAPMLTEGARYALPEEMEADMQEFVTRVADELPNENFLRAAGLGAQRVEGLLDVVKRAYLQ